MVFTRRRMHGDKLAKEDCCVRATSATWALNGLSGSNQTQTGPCMISGSGLTWVGYTGCSGWDRTTYRVTFTGKASSQPSWSSLWYMMLSIFSKKQYKRLRSRLLDSIFNMYWTLVIIGRLRSHSSITPIIFGLRLSVSSVIYSFFSITNMLRLVICTALNCDG